MSTSLSQTTGRLTKRPTMDTPDKVSGLVTSSSPNRSSVSSSYTAPLLATYRSPQNAPSTVMDQDSHSTEDRTNRATSVLSMDDLEAAQALEGLRSGEYRWETDLLAQREEHAANLNRRACRLWTFSSSIAADSTCCITRSLTVRTTPLAVDLLAPADLVRDQRFRVGVHYFQVVLGTFQV